MAIAMMTATESKTAVEIAEVFAEISALDEAVRAAGDARCSAWLPEAGRPTFTPSARNMGAYLALRDRDLLQLQTRLAHLGLSSLGRSEGHVLATLAAVRSTLATLSGNANETTNRRPTGIESALGERLLHLNTRSIFGSSHPHIMVTLASESAVEYDFVRRLIEAGMDCARINCAHDDAELWRAMAANVRQAARDTQRPCRIYMDIAGPKLRVGTVTSRHPKRHVFAGDTVTMTCTEPMVYEHVRSGAPVWIDDGKLGAVVLRNEPNALVLQITHAPPDGARIRPQKGLNFPQTRLPLPALSEKDLADLEHIAAHADIVGQSFVRSAADVSALLHELQLRNVQLPIIAKVETADAVANLPEIIAAGASHVPFGVMIARGDLAIEIGYPRLAQIQEELLWLCESAHVPVVWATQVLDNFVQQGIPSRAEITDAATAQRAECVMLNKGPYVVEAIAVLADVLDRMHGLRNKNSPRLRALHEWTHAS